MRVDASELTALARDLGTVSARTTLAVAAVYKKGATDIREAWRENALATSGDAAKRYPDTIAAWPRVGTNIEWEIYPDERVNGQANLGAILERGSPTSPAHLNDLRAVDKVEPTIEKAVTEAVDKTMSGLGL